MCGIGLKRNFMCHFWLLCEGESEMKIDWKTFMDTADEFHAFAVGWSEVIAFWRPVFQRAEFTPVYILHEPHYYMFGRAIGFITILLILIGFAKLIQVIFF